MFSSSKPRLEFSFITRCRPRNRRRNPWLLALILAALLVAMSSVGDAASAPLSTNIHELSVENGLLTLEAEGAPLGIVLQSIASEAAFHLVLRRDLDAPVTQFFAKVPLDRALLRLLGNVSALMAHGSAPGAPGVQRGAQRRLTALYVLGELVPDVGGQQEVVATPALAERLRHARELANKPNGRDVGGLVRILAQDGDPAVRRVAALGLGKLGMDEARAALSDALADEDDEVRKRAVQALGRAWGSRAVEPLSTALLEDREPSVRRLAANTLGRTGDEDARPSLVKAQSDTDRSVRAAAAAALARLETRAAYLE